MKTTKRQDCLRWAAEHGISISGNQGNGIAVAGPDGTHNPDDNWITVFDTWEQVETFFKLGRDIGYVAALTQLNAY